MQADWGKDVRGQPHTSVPLENWAILYTGQNANNARGLVDCLRQVVDQMRIRMNLPKG